MPSNAKVEIILGVKFLQCKKMSVGQARMSLTDCLDGRSDGLTAFGTPVGSRTPIVGTGIRNSIH